MELDHLKSEFIGTLSYELKTPLTTLLGYVEYLQAGKHRLIWHGLAEEIEKLKSGS